MCVSHFPLDFSLACRSPVILVSAGGDSAGPPVEEEDEGFGGSNLPLELEVLGCKPVNGPQADFSTHFYLSNSEPNDKVN